MGSVGDKIAAAIAAIISLAVLAIIISQRANTANVLSAFFGGVSNLIAVAVSPVTGATVQGNAGGLAGGQWTLGSSGTSGFAVSSNGGGIGSFLGGVIGGAASAFGGSGGGSALGGLGSVAGGFVDSGTF